MTDFIFRLDGFHLTKEQTSQISAAIQSAVTTELARLDLHATASAGAGSATRAGGGSGGTFAHYPILWNGGILLKSISALEGALKTMPTVQTSAIG
jgi:hypothetical protein